MPEECAECSEVWEGPQKFVIIVVTLCLVICSGVILFLGTQARTSDEFVQIAIIGSVESNDAFDSRSAVNVVTTASLITMIAGFSGCWGAAREDRCCLCSFSMFAGIVGIGLIIACIVLRTVLKSQAPTIAKAVNRMCDPLAIVGFKSHLNCGAKFEEHRRLVARSAPTNIPGIQLLAAWVLAREALPLVDISLELKPVAFQRRLLPGMTEESLVIRSCSRLGKQRCASPCEFLDLICQPPEGFDEMTACVCDRSGPRVQERDRLVRATCPNESSHMCRTDVTGRHLGVFCQTLDFRKPEDEGCFVLPSAVCSESSGMASSSCKADSSQPCISRGPCIFPDSRSRVFLKGHQLGVWFASATGCLGTIITMAALCACCLCWELHTGKSMFEQVTNLTRNQALDEPDSDNEDIPFS